MRNSRDCEKIFRDVLARASVTAGGTARQHAVGIFQRDRKSVDLLFHDKFRAGKLFAEFPDFRQIKHVLQALHGNFMRHGGKFGRGSASDFDCGGILVAQVGKCRFQFPQFPHERVVLVIFDFRRVGIVISVAVVFDQTAQFLYALSHFIEIFEICHTFILLAKWGFKILLCYFTPKCPEFQLSM